MANALQKNKSYPEYGYRIDGKGIAYDLTTGKPLGRSEVDARLNAARAGGAQIDERQAHRGGIAGVYDRNKKVINPAAELALGLIPGVGPALAAGYGAAVGGFDHEGQGGVKLDPMQAALGGVKGYGLGSVGAGVGSALSGATAPTLGTAGTVGSTVADASVPGSLGGVVKSAVSGLMPTSIGDAVSKVGGLIPKALGAVQNATGGQGLGMTALETAQGLNAANLSRQSTDAANKAVGIMQQNYDAKAPLRDAGIKGLLNPVPLDTSGISAMRLNSNNPFARPIAVGG